MVFLQLTHYTNVEEREKEFLLNADKIVTINDFEDYSFIELVTGETLTVLEDSYDIIEMLNSEDDDEFKDDELDDVPERT